MSGSAPVPKDFNEWMRRMERQVTELARRQVPRAVYDTLSMNTPRWKSRLVASASLAANTPTTLAYSSVYGSPQHSPGGNDNDFFRYALESNQGRIYVKQSGLYLVHCTLQFAGATGGSRKINVFRNADNTAFASGEASPTPTAGIGTRAEATMPIALAAGDFIYPVAVSSGVAVNITAVGTSGQGGYADSTLSIVPLGGIEFVA